MLVLAPIAAPVVAGALSGRRWRLADLGAGEELRQHELSRRWVWQPAPDRRPGRAEVHRLQGEIVHERPWPTDVEYVPMTGRAIAGRGCRSARGSTCSSAARTGTGKTTTARRLLAARTLAHGASALLIDQKGDPEDEEQLRADRGGRRRAVRAVRPARPRHGSLAAAVGRAGGRRRAGGRADQEVRAVLRRRAAPAPEPDRRSAPRRGPLAAELPAARRRRPRKPLRDDLRSRRRSSATSTGC